VQQDVLRQRGDAVRRPRRRGEFENLGSLSGREGSFGYLSSGPDHRSAVMAADESDPRRPGPSRSSGTPFTGTNR